MAKRLFRKYGIVKMFINLNESKTNVKVTNASVKIHIC